ncbi:MAG: hypothetical protein JXQ30_02500 [Spirochaetes bacterium]|nr:hypothetical protein [Spirochaetota bacterium]
MEGNEGKTAPEEEVRFHYDRARRLGRIHRDLYPNRSRRRWIRNKRTRNMLVILLDLIIIAGVFYFASRPANVFLKKTEGAAEYELNVTGIRGKKVLIGFTVRNAGDSTLELPLNVPVRITLSHDEAQPVVIEEYFEQNDPLDRGESSSVVILLDEDALPGSATLELFFGGEKPLFSKRVRF